MQKGQTSGYSVQWTQWNSDICNDVKGILTFVHWSTGCTGSPGPLGFGYGPPNATVWLLLVGEVIARG